MFDRHAHSTLGGRLIGALLLGLAAQASARDYAVGVAVTQCRTTDGGRHVCSWAAEPAQAAAATLAMVTPTLAGTRGERSQYATGQPLELPTRAALDKAFRQLRDEAGAGDRVVLYLATALVRDRTGQPYLLTDDTVLGAKAPGDGRSVDNALSLDDLAAHIRRLTASRVLVLLDLCTLDSAVRSAELRAAFGESATRCVLAWSADRTTYWEPQGKLTRLAGQLLDALRGAADADADGRIRHAELIGYVGRESQAGGSGDPIANVAVLGSELDWEHELRPAHLDAIAVRLAAAVARTVQAQGRAGERIAVQEPVAATGSAPLTPHAKILARRLAAALADRGLKVAGPQPDVAAITVSGRLEVRDNPDRLVVALDVRAGTQRLGTVRDTALATGDWADLVLPTARLVSVHSRAAASLSGLRAARVEGVAEESPARHPHFTDYAGLPVRLRFELTDAAGENAAAIQPVEVGGDCYLPVQKGRCFRILAARQSATPCAMLVLIDGGNVMSTADLSEDARFAAPEEHLARLNYFILDEQREYAIADWITLGTERKQGPAAARRFVVADGPDAVGFRQPGAELGEVRILLYAARSTSAGERAAVSEGLGMAAGAAAKLPMSFVQWRADASVPHARLIYRYRQPEDIPPASPR